MSRPLKGAKARRQRHAVFGIEIVQALRDRERRVWTDVRDVEHPRLVTLTCIRPQPLDRALRDAPVVLLIVRGAGTRALHVEVPEAAVVLGRLFTVAAQQVLDRALAFVQVHGLDLFAEAVVIFVASVVQLAHCDYGVAGIAQAVHPARHATVVDDRVVPITRLVRIATGGDARTRRTAERARAPRLVVTHARRRDAVDVRGLHNRVAVTAGHCAIVVVGLKEDEVGGFHQSVNGEW
jgi:hypothetical protein